RRESRIFARTTISRSRRRSLYLAAHAARIIDWPVPEGRLLLRDLMEHATQPQFVYRHVWRDHDLVILGKRATMHPAPPFARPPVPPEPPPGTTPGITL